MLTTSKPFGRWVRPAAATGLLLLLAGCTPPGPKALLDGERLMAAGKPDDAIRRLRTAVEFLPANAQAWNHLGLAYHGARRAGEAVEAYQQALRLDRNLAVAYFNVGCLYLEQGEPVLASDSLWAFVGLQPRAVEGWVRLGQAQLRTRKWDQAERSFVEALRLDPGRADALNGLGVAYHQRRNLREAWQSFTNAIARDPAFAPAYLNLGVIAHQNGARAQAMQAYRHYAHLRPEIARQLNLASVIARLEAPPLPAFQPPPAPTTNASPISPVPAAPRAAMERPIPDSDPLTSPTVLAEAPAPASLGNSSSLARPPPEDTAPDVEVPALPDEPVGREITETSPVAVPPPASTPSQMVSTVDPPAEIPTAPSPAVISTSSPPDSFVLPVPSLAGIQREAAPETNQAPAPSTRSVPESVIAESVIAESERVELERVELPPADTLLTGVRDESDATSPPAPTTSPSDSQALASNDDVPPPLVRPIAAQRAVQSADRSEKKGFWSRANPVNWFGSEEASAREASPGEGPPPEAADSGSSWRWANPASWFRGDSGAVSVAESPRPGPPPSGSTNPATQPLEMAAFPEPPASVQAPIPRPSPTSGVVRVITPVRPGPIVEPPTPEIRRYSYLRPAKPVAGNRAASRPVLTRAIEEHRRDRVAAAAELYEEALRLDPASTEALQNLAVAAMRLGNLPRALSAGETALVLQPQSGTARLNFALALDQAGFPGDAAAEAERVIAANPDNSAAHLLLGNLYSQQLGLPDRARAHYLRVIELDPEHPQSFPIRRWLAGR